MDMIIRPVSDIVKLMWGPIGRRIGYIKNLKKNMKELEKQDLFAAREVVSNKIMSNEPNAVCKKWLENVKQIEDEVKAIREEFEGDKKCLIGWCPNIYSRMKLGKRVQDIIKEMTDQSKKRLEFEGKEFFGAPLEKVLLQNVESNSLTATERTLKKILIVIEDDKTKRIGVWGMGGVGKTTTMKLLNDRLEGSLAFEIVIWVTVSKAGNRKNVQNAIAERLELNKSESDDRLKASICKALRRKKFLLLLDDVWERIDLSDVGIPPLNEVDGCKVVLTTRDLKVCRQMKTNKDVKVETLSEDEAWNLFIKSAGDVAMTSNIKQLAEGIVKECGGLPLAINVVGSSLRNNDDVVVWRNTLRELQSPTTSENEDMEEQVFHCLRTSYDLLKDDGKKKLFLYCSLYPEDNEILITELVEYCWLEGYIHGVGSIEVAREKGHSMVMNLVDASLLEKDEEGYVKMHDVVRDFALREAPGFLVKVGMNINDPLEEKEWLQMQKISLMESNLCNLLLERPNYSTLSTLLLQDSYQLTKISDSFFECMHSLCILDLSWTKIKSLPSSLCNLVNLHGLYLKSCVELKELPSQVGALKQLEVLDLGDHTAIKYLPREVGELTRLKRLRVRFQYCICSLNDDYVDCSEDDDNDDARSKDDDDKDACSQDDDDNDAYSQEDDDDEDSKEWNMKFRVPTGIISKLPYLEELRLDGDDVRSCEACSRMELWDSVDMGRLDVESRRVRFDELELDFFFDIGEYLPGVECEMMKTTLFDGDEKQKACALLPNLKLLKLRGLRELRSLCDGPFLPGSLSKLRKLCLSDCKNLKKVFQLGIIRQLCSLESLYVFNCPKIEEIVEIEEEMSMSVASHTHNVISYNNDRLILPNIKSIYLVNLHEFVSICRGFSNFEWPSLETIQILSCPKMKSLSFLSNGTNIVAPKLKCIQGLFMETLEWEDNDIKQRLQPFFRQC